MVVISRRRGLNRNSVVRFSWLMLASSEAASCIRAISVGSPLRPAAVTSAVQHWAAVAAKVQASATAWSVPTFGHESRPSSAAVPEPAAVHTPATSIRFCVNVPVLSVQMTVVDPRVSTAERRLTTAPRRARSWTPTAKAKVMVGSNPSGTLATSIPMAKLAAAASDSPASAPRGMNASAATTATTAINLATFLT